MSETAQTPIGEISDTAWVQTPESVRQLVRSLLGRIEELEARCQGL